MLRGGVFISYRSDPSVDFAGRLYLYLAHVFGSDYVFLDSHITPGFDFMKVIVGSIPRSAVFLSVVDETWHTRKGRRALYKPDDPVRVEVETALRGQPLVTVIPIYVNQTKALRARRLPAGLAQLAGINGFRIHSKTFEADGERLVATVRDELTRPRPPAREDSGRAGRDGPTRKAAFDAIRGFGKARKGYDFRQVITGLEDVLSRISDPDWCTELQPPFFDLASRGDGFSVPEVDRYIIGRRPAASNFDQGLRWMFADQGLLGAGVPTETRASARLRERVGMVSDEQFLCVVDLRLALASRWNTRLVFTDRALRLRAQGCLFSVPYSDVAAFEVTQSSRSDAVCSGYDSVPVTLSRLTVRYRGCRSS